MSWLTATEALQVLGVRPQTLYANVSRKRIRAKPDPKDTRRSLYHEVDVRKLARQQGGRRKATLVAAGAIEWGDPVLSSAVSTVVEGRLYYRGKDAVGLSESGTLEGVAGLLWGADVVDFELAWREWGGAVAGAVTASRAAATSAAFWRGAAAAGGGAAAVAGTAGGRSAVAAIAAGTGRDAAGPAIEAALGTGTPAGACARLSSTPLHRAFLALGQCAGSDMSSYGRSLPVLQSEAAEVLVTLASSMLESEGSSRPRRSSNQTLLHERIAASFGRHAAGDILRRALVLLADHELNASTFATRVAVSTGAPLSAGVLSGLATLSGPLHGRAALGVLELVASVERSGADKAVRDWLSQGRPVAGFGHPLYPAGDPRAVELLQRLTLPRAYTELSEVVENVIGERPNIDFALAALTKVHRLPADAPLILFALGRCAGWLAHALEQVTTGHPIRPRARYVGPPISSSA